MFQKGVDADTKISMSRFAKKTWRYFSTFLIKIWNNNANAPSDYYFFFCYMNS